MSRSDGPESFSLEQRGRGCQTANVAVGPTLFIQLAGGYMSFPPGDSLILGTVLDGIMKGQTAILTLDDLTGSTDVNSASSQMQRTVSKGQLRLKGCLEGLLSKKDGIHIIADDKVLRAARRVGVLALGGDAAVAEEAAVEAASVESVEVQSGDNVQQPEEAAATDTYVNFMVPNDAISDRVPSILTRHPLLCMVVRGSVGEARVCI